MIIETFSVGPLACNCTIIAEPQSKEAIVIDPGGDFELIKQKLEALKVNVSAILHTHTHFDHVGATPALQRYTFARACIHEDDRFLYKLLPVQASMFHMPCPEMIEMEGSLVDSATFRIGSRELVVLHTPGHTPGSCSFLLKQEDKSYVFTGDTLFRRSIGRTDLWGGDSSLILKSIRQKLLTLEPDTVVIPGHGVESLIGEEKEQNRHLTSLIHPS